ncbi:MAG: hypothetical protein M3552_01030 [Planctomycetota bacterium]|nr:hypothetical protein [Planctomycetaceae bacterium]MDQ3329229.1 hypothetical protein [Planctomycetota bacterium]
MIGGIERLRHAREKLNQTGQPTSYSPALIEAAEECWSASIDGGEWPVHLRVQMTILQRTMFRHGGIRASVERMSDHERSRLQDGLLNFIAAAERACVGNCTKEGDI